MESFQSEHRKHRIPQKPYFSRIPVNQNHLFLKRFPKYLAKFNVNLQKNVWKVQSKLKKTKIIQTMLGLLSHKRPISKYLPLLILQNKTKSLHEYHAIHPSILHYFPNFIRYECILQDQTSSKAFLKLFNLKALRLIPSFSYGSRQNDTELLKPKMSQWRFSIHFKKMKNLKVLQFYQKNSFYEHSYLIMKALEANHELL